MTTIILYITAIYTNMKCDITRHGTNSDQLNQVGPCVTLWVHGRYRAGRRDRDAFPIGGSARKKHITSIRKF